ncbi:MAG: hypothetical protein ACIAZJ_27125 [Gimesia chilikensis]|uniref:hypothetical protein n=1 Tax=Gimesia chilikensis TaxID=2605989 RepID=UPI0037B987DC
MKYLIAFVAVAGLITTGVSSQQPRGRGDRDCQCPGGPPPDPFMVLFDTDQDGRISTNEMDQSAVALKNLDRDQDGSLTREELPRPPRPLEDQGHRRDDRHGTPPMERGRHQHAERPGHHGPPQRGERPDARHERPRHGHDRHERDRREQGRPGPSSDRNHHEGRPHHGPPRKNSPRENFPRENSPRPPRPDRDHIDAPLPPAVSENVPAGTVIIEGGYETDPRDHGRPVNLIAAALGVEPQVFRDAFSNVRPARNGAPTEARARANKEVLLAALGKYGITNERLDEVSNYYRYQPHNGEVWKRTPASATAVIKDGKVTGFNITRAGSGYTTPPRITVAGYPDLQITAALQFGPDFSQNGSLKSLTIK